MKEKFVGGLRLPQDETGDCHMFTQALADIAEALGVRFLFNTGIDRIVTDGGARQRRRDQRRHVAGRRLCAGAGNLFVADGHAARISLPVYPVKGYSITVPIKELRRAGIDRDGRELQGRHHPSRQSHPRRRHRRNLRLLDPALDARRATLDHSLTDLFPRGGDLSKARSGAACAR